MRIAVRQAERCAQRPGKTVIGISQTASPQMISFEKMEKENDYVILDVRTKNEYDQGHIPNALLVPNENIDSSIVEKLPSKDQTIYVYCRSGNRSKQAANKLLKMGYTDVIDIGGINDWPNELAYD